MEIKYRYKDKTYTITQEQVPSRKHGGAETFYFISDVPCDLGFTNLKAAKAAIRDGSAFKDPEVPSKDPEVPSVQAA